jgi:DNA-binding MarR family transcriptional regulator
MAAKRADRTAPGTAHELNPVDGVAQFTFLVYSMLERRAAERELSIIQTRLLGVLRDRRPTINELANLLALDKSSVSGLVERAERRGLVTRTPSPADRRAVLVGLTEAGRSLIAQASSEFGADVQGLLSGLSPSDRRTLTKLLSRLLVTNASGRGIDLFPDGRD